MARQPTSTTRNSNVSAVSHFHSDPLSWAGSSTMSPLSSGHQKSDQAFLMPTSAVRRRGSADYRPSIRKAQGHVPACLVNASVTYCNDDQIYAFGGFDQYTDEGPLIPPLARLSVDSDKDSPVTDTLLQCTTMS